MRRSTHRFAASIALAWGVVLLGTAASAAAAEIHPDLRDALKEANRQGKVLLVDFYGGWCPWCVKLDKTFEDPGVRALLRRGFHYVKLDVGRFERHRDCMKQYGVRGIPLLLALSPDGSVRARKSGYLDAKACQAFLQSIAPRGGPPGGIHPDLREALGRATQQGKLLLVDFHGGWCPWCVKLDKSMEDPAVRPVLDASFWYHKLDIGRFERHTGCTKRYAVKGIPHLIVFHPDGSVLASRSGTMSPRDLLRFLQRAASNAKPSSAIHPDLGAALREANRGSKLLLVDFHGGWCPWCLKMDRTLEDARVQAVMARGFHYCKLDVGRFERHAGCTRQYKVRGIPHVIVFNPDGTVRAAKGGYMAPAAFLAFLVGCQPKRPAAGLEAYRLEDFGDDKDPIKAAVAKAAGRDKRLLVYFYSERDDAHEAILKRIAELRSHALAGRFALLAVEQPDNRALASRYGCARTPFTIVFRKNGNVCWFFQEAFSKEQLLETMKRALEQG